MTVWEFLGRFDGRHLLGLLVLWGLLGLVAVGFCVWAHWWETRRDRRAAMSEDEMVARTREWFSQEREPR